MNEIDFTQPGGFPLDQDVFSFQQSNIALASQAAALGGQLAILSGCTIAGQNAGSGYVVINGEVLPFVGGAIQPKVIIVQTTNNLNYEDGVSRPSEKVRYATFGDDGTNFLWANFKRNTTEGVLARLERLERVSAPFLVAGKGGMILWKRAANLIPEGWAEVVDWRGRLAMGYDPNQTEFNEVGKTGGNKNKALTAAENGPHTHSYNDIFHSETGGPVGVPGNGGSGDSDNDNGGYQMSRTTGSSGSGQQFSILNPYRVVMFIEYTGV